MLHFLSVQKSLHQITGVRYRLLLRGAVPVAKVAHLRFISDLPIGLKCVNNCARTDQSYQSIIMKRGTLNFLGRKNQSLFDTNIKIKDMGE